MEVGEVDLEQSEGLIRDGNDQLGEPSSFRDDSIYSRINSDSDPDSLALPDMVLNGDSSR